MIGVFGLEDSDLGLEIIELLSGGYSGVDGLDTVCGRGGPSIVYKRRRGYAHAGDIKKPLSIGIGT